MQEQKVINIEMIESISQKEISSLCEDSATVKEHTLYFVDFGGYFGYSCCVFLGDAHLYYLNDYELHHRSHKGEKEYLKNYYIEEMKRKAFTVEELLTDSKDYEENKRKKEYLYNNYCMSIPCESAFYISNSHTPEENKEREERLQRMLYNPVGFCYYENTEENKQFIKKCLDINLYLAGFQRRQKDNIKYWEDAFLREMFNHEYGINWQGDYDVISCFANVENVKDYENTESLFSAANFSESQTKAYKKAIKAYFSKCNL